MEESCRKYVPRPSPRPLFNFDKTAIFWLNNPKQPSHARDSFKNKII